MTTLPLLNASLLALGRGVAIEAEDFMMAFNIAVLTRFDRLLCRGMEMDLCPRRVRSTLS
jgi:hypothetical protein